MMQALQLLLLVKRHILEQSKAEQEIKPVALAISACLSKVSQLVTIKKIHLD